MIPLSPANSIRSPEAKPEIVLAMVPPEAARIGAPSDRVSAGPAVKSIVCPAPSRPSSRSSAPPSATSVPTPPIEPVISSTPPVDRDAVPLLAAITAPSFTTPPSISPSPVS